MTDNIEDYIEKFNMENNQETSRFGQVNFALLRSDNNMHQVLYYLYPMIERLFRNILDKAGIFDIENAASYTFKTLYSIITQNNDQIIDVFGVDLGDEILYYLNDTYADLGPRNMLMHYHKKAEIPVTAVISAQYIFVKLIKFYVDNYL